jgi:hypothetical protein
MNPILRNILAVVAGLILGGMVNMGIIMISGKIIPPPAGIDMTTMEGIKAGMPLLSPQHFLMPFLAHALGTFVSALVASFIAASHKMKFAIGFGCWGLLGGIIAVMMIPAPLWFDAVDLIFAYLPMGYLGGKLVKMRVSEN